jgi:hypothetical protein
LVQDRRVLARSGQLCSSWELARECGFTDADGTRPDWGAIDIDFSRHPPAFLEYMRTSAEIQLDWLAALSKRTKRFLTQLPRTNAAGRTRARSPAARRG